MKCIQPVILGDRMFGCGQCVCCRVNRQRSWALRIHLESLCWPSSVFWTGTYDDQHLPEGNALSRVDAALFVKRLAERLRRLDIVLRHFIAGEYGGLTGRPHLHGVLYNYPACLFGPFRRVAGATLCECRWCTLLRECWPHGVSSSYAYAPEAAQYVCKDVVKQRTDFGAKLRAGRAREFFTMSRRPALGVPYLPHVAAACRSLPQKVVPAELIFGRSKSDASRGLKFPLSRYLRAKLRDDFLGADWELNVSCGAEPLLLVRQFAAEAGRSVRSVIGEVNAPFAERLEAGARAKRGRM